MKKRLLVSSVLALVATSMLQAEDKGTVVPYRSRAIIPYTGGPVAKNPVIGGWATATPTTAKKQPLIGGPATAAPKEPLIGGMATATPKGTTQLEEPYASFKRLGDLLSNPATVEHGKKTADKVIADIAQKVKNLADAHAKQIQDALEKVKQQLAKVQANVAAGKPVKEELRRLKREGKWFQGIKGFEGQGWPGRWKGFKQHERREGRGEGYAYGRKKESWGDWWKRKWSGKSEQDEPSTEASTKETVSTQVEPQTPSTVSRGSRRRAKAGALESVRGLFEPGPVTSSAGTRLATSGAEINPPTY